MVAPLLALKITPIVPVLCHDIYFYVYGNHAVEYIWKVFTALHFVILQPYSEMDLITFYTQFFSNL